MQRGLKYSLWVVTTAAARRTPHRVLYGLATVVGTAAFYLWPRGRRAMIRNYHRVLQGASPGEIRRVARASLVNYCHYLADFFRLAGLERELIHQAVAGEEAFAALRKALERGRGAVIVCMHFGNWDLGAGAAAARGFPLTVVAETFEDERIDELVVGARQRLGMQVIKLERAGPSLVRTLRQNRLLALLIDRPVPGDGVKVRFFGEEVEVPAGPARLALRTGAPVVPAAFARTRRDRPEVLTLADFSIDYTPTGDDSIDVPALTQRIMDAHEQFIRRYPEQWYMFREMWPGQPATAPA